MFMMVGLGGCIRESDMGEVVVEKSAYEMCVEAGGIILEMNPRQCRDSQGNVYAEKKKGKNREEVEEEVDRASAGAALCEDSCGDGVCQEIVCQGSGCPCAETAISCEIDCD